MVCSKNWAQQTESSLNRVSRHHEMCELRSALKSSVLACKLSVIIHRIPRPVHIKSIGKNQNYKFSLTQQDKPQGSQKGTQDTFQ